MLLSRYRDPHRRGKHLFDDAGPAGQRFHLVHHGRIDAGANAGTSQLCNPTVGSTSCNIAVAAAGTVKAIGMWGQGANTYSYPSGYGFVPSSVASATYTGTSPPTLNSVTLSTTGSVTSVETGASVQMNAACHYNNGATTSCNTTDAYGNSVSSWNTSNTSIVTINGSGLATGVAVGSANLTAIAGV